MPNLAPEKQVKKECLIRLEQWKSWGIVVDYDDVSDLGRGMSLRTGKFFMHTKAGKRDLIAWFKIGTDLCTYLIECKSPDGVIRPAQREYADKFEGLDNVIYEVVYDSKQIDNTLDKLSKRSEKLMQAIDLHMGVMKIEEETW